MATKYAIPQGLNQTWGGATDWLTRALGGIFDPRGQTQPPNIQGMEAGPMPGPPQSLTELMASMVMQGGPKEAYESGIVGMGPMPAYMLRTRAHWHDPKALWIDNIELTSPTEGKEVIKEIIKRANEIGADKIMGSPITFIPNETAKGVAPWQKRTMQEIAKKLGAKEASTIDRFSGGFEIPLKNLTKLWTK